MPTSTERPLHERRVVMMLRVGGVALITLGLGWAIFFAIQGNWITVALDTLLIGVGVSVLLLVPKRRFLLAFALMMACIYLVVCAISLWLDIPTEAAPRTTHHFLLVLAICAQLFFHNAHKVMRHAVVGVFMLTYVFFASTSYALHTDLAVPDHIRLVGSWINAGCSIAALYVLIQIMMSDLSHISSMEAEIQKGLERGEFFLVYQPQITSDSRVVGAEALLRWQHPRLGIVGPALFIELAERTGMIVPIGLQVLETACKQLVEWSKRPEMAHMTLAVNVSAQQFRQDDFVAQVQSVIASTGVDTRSLKLELTESLLIQDIEDIVQKMTALRAIGVGFSLDDFGTGYSSLNYLKRLPLDQLKIDQSFVRDVLTDTSDAAIVRTVIALGQSMGFAVIAEGVETPGQRSFLIENGCHLFQGYLFSKPLPIGQFVEFVFAASKAD